MLTEQILQGKWLQFGHDLSVVETEAAAQKPSEPGLLQFGHDLSVVETITLVNLAVATR